MGAAPATTTPSRATAPKPDRYAWIALANTTAAIFMASLDGSVVIIALPAIFKGINLDPLSAGNIAYLLWMIMGYRLAQAVLVVNLGKLGDMFGRVKMYNAGFVVFTIASILLSFDPFSGGHGAMWLIGWRFLQATGGSMLMANSAAILTDAFPAQRRGFALGTIQVAALAGMFIGLVEGGHAEAQRAKAGRPARELRLGKPSGDHHRERQPQGRRGYRSQTKNRKQQ